MSDSTQARYNYFAQGIEVSVEGRLGGELELKTLDNGNRVMKLSIAYPAGSKKKEDGTYENISAWATLNIWENVNGAKELFAAVTNSESKIKYSKGHSVQFKGRAVINGRVYNDKAFVDFDVKDVYHLYKVYSAPKNDDNGTASNNSSSSLDGLPVTSKPDLGF